MNHYINIGKVKVFPFRRMTTNKYRWDDGIRNSFMDAKTSG